MELNRLLNPEEVCNPLSRVLAISGLLNPDDTPVDIAPLINELASFSSRNGSLLVPLEIHNHLKLALEHIRDAHAPPPQPPPPHIVRPPSPPPNMTINISNFDSGSLTEGVQKDTEVKLNRETVLETLYRYPIGAVVEYPETSSTGFVGHLFRMDPDNWTSPILNVAYSRGMPSGLRKEVFTEILIDSTTGELAPCSVRHTTCNYEFLFSLKL